VSLFTCGVRKGGFTDLIHAVGFNGIVVTGWAEGYPRSIGFKYGDGGLFIAMQLKYEPTAVQLIAGADLGRGRPFCSGRTILFFRNYLRTD
jgi:hypothetical protein